MKRLCCVILLLSLLISKVSGDVTAQFLYEVLSNRITVDGELFRNKISDINSRMDSLNNTVNKFTGTIETENGIVNDEGSVVKPIDENVAIKYQKHETVVKKALADEKLLLRDEINKLSEQLTSENNLLKNKLDTFEDNLSNLTSENRQLRNELNTVNDNVSNLTSENIMLRNKLDTADDNVSNLTREISILRNKLDTVDDNVSELTSELITVDDNIYNLTSETSVLKNALDIFEKSVMIQFEQNGNSNKREMEKFKSSIMASVNVLKEKHVTDLKISENKVLGLVSSLRSDLTSTNYRVSGIKSREEGRRISFAARLERNLIDLPGGSKLPLNSVLHNDGNGYSSTTGIFTCPKSGVYFFVYFVTSYPRQDADGFTRANVVIMVNGYTENQAISRTYRRYHLVQGGSTIVCRLQHDDRVWLETRKKSGTQSVRSHFTTFSGIMLY